MRFSLQDVKRQIRRRDGELTLALHFLRAGELRAEITRLVTYHEQRCGQSRKSFAQDEASGLIGDYRLANCLLATISAWYTWQQPNWEQAVEATGEQARVMLNEAGIHTPVALRLALFDYVNAQYAGFLTTATRPAVLETFAARYGLEVARLEALLALDSDESAVLTRTCAEPPTADEVAGLYNQWVFEVALFNASEVHFTIDCAAFLDAQRMTTTGALTGLGAVVKRLCFLARKLGVYYDLAYEEVAGVTPTTFLHLTLYGPQEMTGSPQQYGQRLARLCHSLLGYGTRGANAGGSSSRRQSSAALGKALREAEAQVYLFQQRHRFTMDAGLLALLPTSEAERSSNRSVVESASIYDSSIEQAFAEAFGALERAQGTDGWQLEREPEPLLLPKRAGQSGAGIVIPDFALTRGQRRIYIEILGFWTPAYRERKLQKLQELRGQAEMILAFPVEARPSFAALEAAYPLIEYRDGLSASEVLRIMQARYDDFAQRLAELDVARIQRHVQEQQFIPERNCYTLLNCYRRAELIRAAARVISEGEIGYIAGVGLYELAWLEHLHRSFVEWVEAQNCAEWPLSSLLAQWRTRWPVLAESDDAPLEALLARWPEVEIKHDSIFEARLIVNALRAEIEARVEDGMAASGEEMVQSSSRKGTRERRSASKKRVSQETSQQNLWE